ncbi:transmembrane and coiled-coil domain-containing protein 6, partial [Clarias magur]
MHFDVHGKQAYGQSKTVKSTAQGVVIMFYQFIHCHADWAVLRQARRDRQLVSKRLLLNDEEQEEELMQTNSVPLSQDQ